jgi:hypothetical protein
MNPLRQQFLSALAEPKVLVAKSSSAPDVLTIYGPRGDVIGFGKPEPVDAAEVQRITELGLPNDLFDESAAFPFGEIQARQQVQKSVPSNSADPNDCLSTLFPFQVVSKSASPDAGEMMNRVAGRNTEETGGREGRPRTSSGKGSPLDRFDPANPETTFDIENGKLVSGSVLKVLMPDGAEQFIFVMADVPIEIFDERISP